jgi:hypothetical protein
VLLLAQAIGIGPAMVLRVLGRTSALVRVRFATLPVVIGLALALPPHFGAPGTVAAVAAGEVLTAVAAVTLLVRQRDTARSEAEMARSADETVPDLPSARRGAREAVRAFRPFTARQ